MVYTQLKQFLFLSVLLTLISCGNAKDVHHESEPERFFVAYFIKDQKTAEFDKVYEQILKDIKGLNVASVQYEYGTNDYKVSVGGHEFDFSYMEQFELRNGFWFHQTGEEPLDFGMDEYPGFMEQVKAYFK